MSIQQSVNQLATIGTALYTQTPKYEAKKVAEVKAREAERLRTDSNKSIKTIQQTAEQDLKTAKPSELKAYMDVTAEYLNKADADIKRAYELNPTPETLRAYIKSKATEYEAKAIQNENNDWMRQYDEEMASKANAISEKQMQAMKSQKDRIKSRFENLSTSLGGKVKDLSPELQDAIRRQLEKDGK